MSLALAGGFFTTNTTQLSYIKVSPKSYNKCPFFFNKKNLFIWLCWVSSEKAMAPYSSTLAWKIPWTEEPGRLRSMESLRVGYD